MNNKPLRLALISTGVGVVDPIKEIVHEIRPDTTVINIVDDSIVQTIADNGNVIPHDVIQRLLSYVAFAEKAGADAALVTCSSISEVVDVAAPTVGIPVFKIDEPMADKAVASANCVGVAATLATTLEPTKRLLAARAKKAGKEVALKETLCAGAFEALQNGDTDKHDQIVREAVLAMLQECDVVVLAQASMARAVTTLGDAQEKVLTSPRLGVSHALDYLNQI